MRSSPSSFACGRSGAFAPRPTGSRNRPCSHAWGAGVAAAAAVVMAVVLVQPVSALRLDGTVTEAHKVWMKTEQQVYGQLLLKGSVEPLEFFRATFGALMPCASRDIVIAEDIKGCGSHPESVKGRLVVVERGNCTFVDKAHAAQIAGAAGLLIANVGGGLIRPPWGNLTASNVTIPVVMVRNYTLPMLQSFAAAGTRLHGAFSVLEKCRPLEDERTGPLPLDKHGKPLAREVDADGEGALTDGSVEWQYVPPHAGDWKPTITRAGTVKLDPAPVGHPDGEFYMGFFGGVLPDEPLPMAWASPRLACESVDNPAALEGKWAVVERGACELLDKASVIAATGARGVVIINSGDFGIVRPASREERPNMTLPVLMVAKPTGADFDAAIAADGTVLFENDPNKDGRGWESLVPGAPFVLPEDSADRLATLEQLVARHHPAGPMGHSSRWERFTFVSSEAGYGGEVTAVAARYELQIAKSETGTAGSQNVRTPLTMLGGFPATALAEDHKLVRCHTVGGKYQFPKPEYKESSRAMMYSRLADAVLNMACMEQVMYWNAELIGHYYEDLLNTEEDTGYLVRTLRGIFRRVFYESGSQMRDTAAARSVLEDYMALHRVHEALLEQDGSTSIRDFLASQGLAASGGAAQPTHGEIDV